MNTPRQTTMELRGLRSLHRDMRKQGQYRASFGFRSNNARVEVVFITDERPYVLLIAAHGETLHSFELPVFNGYRVPTYLGENYKPLLDALGITPNPENPFSTRGFLDDLNSQIPANWARREIPTELLAKRRSAASMEESDKIFFLRWQPHTGSKQVSQANLEKTRLLIGSKTAERCAKSNISSCWTSSPTERNPVTDPPM